ncbi:hypothetical protein BJ170DRAFT_594049 [Xylariales sp. AK1849]|nr:hypothetical protein BJ170DRAFT_594049 [Xylariales sp. AK1849]
MYRHHAYQTISPQLLRLTPEDDTMSDTSTTIRVAIMGGGLAGAALLRGLLLHPHIIVDMYESRPSFREEGPGVDLGPTAQAVLHAIDPMLDYCLDRAGAVYSSTEVRIAIGPNAGQRIDLNGHANRGKRTVGRQDLLTELLAGVPPRRMHTNTRLTSITQGSAGNGLILTFADGTQKKYDVVIGADGVHGKTRAHVIGPDDLALNPRPSGFWGLPIKVPLERAQQAMGTEFLDPRNPRQVAWIGDGTLMQHDLLNNGREVQIITAGRFDTTDEEFAWAKLFTPEEFEDIYSQNLSEACRGIVKLVESVYTVQIAGICQMEHVPTRTYSTKNACLVGDAAHGLLSYQGAASSVAMEEALILSTLLGRTTSTSDVAAALRAFDQVCRPRAERVVRASFDVGLLMTGRAPGIGLDPTLLAKTLQQKWDCIENFDINAYRTEAISSMDQLVMGRGW